MSSREDSSLAHDVELKGMSSDEDSVLTLKDICNCMKKYWPNLVFLQDSQFYQVSSYPKWIKAILSHAIISFMPRNSGELDSSEVSNFINKNIGAPSHNIDAKFNNIYKELTKEDCRAIEEEEMHLHIVLSRCAYILALDDSKKWGSISKHKGRQLSDRYKTVLSGIKTFSPEGKALSNEIRSSLIASIGLKIGRQCLPYYYTSDDIKESQLPEILKEIDSVRLLTAAIIIALNYQNNSSERRINDETVDSLTMRIHSYLLPDSTSRTRSSSVSIDTEFAHQSKQVIEDDELLIKAAALAHDIELQEIRTDIKRLVSKLIGNAYSDITNELRDVIYCCRRAQFVDNLRFAIKQLGHCESLTSDRNKFSDDVHLSILLALIPLEIELILQEIDALKEQFLSCRNRYDRESLSTLIESKYIKLDEKNKESKQYLHELERLQQEGLPKDSVLSLHIPKRQENK